MPNKRNTDALKNEFDGVFDEEQLAQMENEIDKEAIPVDEYGQTTESYPLMTDAPIPEWKRRLQEAKARASKPADKVILNEKLAPNVETIPGDMSTPQTPLESHIEADRKFVRNVIDTEETKAVERSLTVEALYVESVGERSVDRDRFKRVFIETIQQSCAGKTIAECEDMLRDRHELLYDMRAGIQAILAYRAELLKDATAEERARALESDYLYKPQAKEKKEKKSSEPKVKKSPMDLIRAALKAKGLSDEEVAKRMKAFEGK